MATRYHIGAKDLRSDIGAYAKRFDLLEVRLPAASDRRLGPTVATLKRWRRATPPHFVFSVVVGPSLSRLKPSPELDAELAHALETVNTLEARCLVLSTPPEVTPGAAWRDRMARLLERLPRDASHVVWEPHGVWEVEDAAVAAKKWGVVLAVDAGRDPVPAGAVAYVRLPSLGETRSYGVAALEKVANAIGDRREAFVVIETATALAECKRLRAIGRQGGRRATGGGSRVVRPRPAVTIMKVRDDEQE